MTPWDIIRDLLINDAYTIAARNVAPAQAADQLPVNETQTRRGQKISYVEIDGVPACLAANGDAWCQRESGHDGPHVLAAQVKGPDHE